MLLYRYPLIAFQKFTLIHFIFLQDLLLVPVFANLMDDPMDYEKSCYSNFTLCHFGLRKVLVEEACTLLVVFMPLKHDWQYKSGCCNETRNFGQQSQDTDKPRLKI